MANKVNINRSWRDKKHPPGVYWDAKVAGYGVRIGAKGTPSYFVQRRMPDGQQVKRTIALVDAEGNARTPEQLRDEAERQGNLIRAGIDPAEPRPSKDEAASFGTMLTLYCDYLDSQQAASAGAVRSEVQNGVRDAFPGLWRKPAASVTLTDCASIVRAKVSQGKRRQGDKLRSYMIRAFRLAATAPGNPNLPDEWRQLGVTMNPARELQKPEGAIQAKTRHLSVDELRAYWKRVDQLPEPRRSILAIHLLTGGQRQDQLRRALWADVDRDAGTFGYWDSKGRNGRQNPRWHALPLTPRLLQHMQALSYGGPFILSHTGGDKLIGVDYIRDAVRDVAKAMEAAGELPGGHFTPGDLRASIETRLTSKPYSVSEFALGKLLSHGQGGVQQKHYQRGQYIQEKLDGLRAIERLLALKPIKKRRAKAPQCAEHTCTNMEERA